MDHIVLFPHLGSGIGLHPPRDGSARGRQSRGLGARQAAAHAGAGNPMAAQEAGLKRAYRSAMMRTRPGRCFLVACCVWRRPGRRATGAGGRRRQSSRRCERCRQGRARDLGDFQRRPRQDLHRDLQGRPGAGGLQARVRPRLRHRAAVHQGCVAWIVGSNDSIRMIDAKGRSCSNSPRSRPAMYEAERRGEGILFMQNRRAAASGAPHRRAVVRRMGRHARRTGTDLRG